MSKVEMGLFERMTSRGITFLGLRAIRKSSKHLASVYFLHFHHCIFPLYNDLNLRSTVFVNRGAKKSTGHAYLYDTNKVAEASRDTRLDNSHCCHGS